MIQTSVKYSYRSVRAWPLIKCRSLIADIRYLYSQSIWPEGPEAKPLDPALPIGKSVQASPHKATTKTGKITFNEMGCCFTVPSLIKCLSDICTTPCFCCTRRVGPSWSGRLVARCIETCRRRWGELMGEERFLELGIIWRFLWSRCAIGRWNVLIRNLCYVGFGGRSRSSVVGIIFWPDFREKLGISATIFDIRWKR